MSSLIALTHAPSPRITECELTYLSRSPIDYPHAVRQHAAYGQMLRRCGAEVVTLDVNRDFPDSVFIEDVAIVLDEIAILASMGRESRRREPDGIEPVLRAYREVRRIERPATIEGGDVLRVGRHLLVGLSSRTNREGLRRLGENVARFGYDLIAVPVRGCLHLKTACTALPDHRLLLNPAWLGDLQSLRGFDWIRIPEEEPRAANMALVGDTVCMDESHARTAEMIGSLGFRVFTVDLSEFAKAEGAVTCSSIVFTRS